MKDPTKLKPKPATHSDLFMDQYLAYSYVLANYILAQISHPPQKYCSFIKGLRKENPSFYYISRLQWQCASWPNC